MYGSSTTASLDLLNQVDNLAMNGEVTGDISLRNLWTWLDAAKSLATTGNFKLPGGVPYRFQGVWLVLHYRQDCVFSIVTLLSLMLVETFVQYQYHN